MKTNYNISAKIVKDAGRIKEHAEKNHPQVEPEKAEGDKSGENDQAADETQAAQAFAYSNYGVATEQAGTGAVATGTRKRKAGKVSMKNKQSNTGKNMPKHKQSR